MVTLYDNYKFEFHTQTKNMIFLAYVCTFTLKDIRNILKT